MSKKKIAGEKPKASSLKEAGLESFDVMELHRGELKGADYNPRFLTESQKRKLKAGLKRHGLVTPVTWNRQTGNIVGGHQRLGVLDGIMGTGDYKLHVAVIDVPLAREKELNILLNNTHAMGDWDLEKLDDLLRDDELSLDGTGFDAADVMTMLGANPLADRMEDMEEMGARFAEVREQYDQIRGKNSERDNTEFYLVIVFRDNGEVTKFLDDSGLPDSRYQSGDEFFALLEKANAGASA